uniref:Uncharacterized protein n=1 Tax=Ciona savignyi TaxID=51511 RepID=H2Z5J5_CIOSA
YNSTPVKANLFPNLIPKFQDLDSPHGDSRELSKPGLPKPNILKEELRSQNVSSTTVQNNNKNSLSSSGSDLVFTPDKDQHSSPTFQPNSFILGSTPSKIDRDVILAIGNTEVSSNDFPCTWKWMKSVLSYKEADRQRWRTPKQASSAQSSYKGAPVAFTWPASPLARNRWTPIDSPMSKLALPNE